MALNTNLLLQKYIRTPESADTAITDLRFTRRGFLAGSLSLALTTPRIIRGLGTSVKVVQIGDGASLLVDSIARWSFRPELFADQPKVAIAGNQRDHITIRLFGARYPGTTLSADTLCDIRLKASGWNLRLKFLGGIAQLEADLFDWLENSASFISVCAPRRIANLGQSIGLELNEDSSVSLLPNWTLLFRGPRVVSLNGLGPSVFGRELAIRAVPCPIEAKSDIEILRGQDSWAHLGEEMFRSPELWRKGEILDRAALELSDATPEPTLVFNSISDTTGRCGIQVTSGLYDSHGVKPTIAIGDVLYAVSAKSHKLETALLGRLANGFDAHGDGFIARVEDPTATPAVQVFAEDGIRKCGSAVAEVRKIATPDLDPDLNRVVAALGINDGAAISLWNGTPTAQQETTEPSNESAALDRRARICLDRALLSLLRPDDLLSINVRFKNLSLGTHDGKPYLFRSQPGDKSLDATSRSSASSCVVDKGPCYLSFEFPPQSIAEQCFLAVAPTASDPCGDQSPEEPPHRPVKTLLSEGSCLVFCVPDRLLKDSNQPGVPFTLETLLGWSSMQPSLHRNALAPDDTNNTQVGSCPSDSPADAQPPGEWQTRIEFPYRLLLSPHWKNGWLHTIHLPKHDDDSDQPVRAELWHSLLGSKVTDENGPRVDLTDSGNRAVRAIWSRDFPKPAAPGVHPPAPPAPPFRLAMSDHDRYQIVQESSNYKLQTIGIDDAGHITNVPYKPKPVQIKHLALSGLGAWFDGIGQWEPPIPAEVKCDAKTDYDLESWTHRASQGRDHFVKLVYRGFLLPFGHRAVLIKETQRFFYCEEEPVDPFRNICYLRQKLYIVVREPKKLYPAEGQAYRGRHLPFHQIEFRTLITPALDDPTSDPVATGAFWPLVHGEPFQWLLDGSDWASTSEHSLFRMPMVFVENCYGFDPAMLDSIRTAYLAKKWAERRETSFAGQGIHFAASEKPGDTKIKCQSMQFDIDVATKFNGDSPDDRWRDFDSHITQFKKQPFFYPALELATIDLPPVQHVSGDDRKTDVSYPARYLKHGFSQSSTPSAGAMSQPEPHNPGEVFLALVKNAEKRLLQFPGANGGGLVVPNVSIQGVSRKLGAIAGDVEQVATNKFDPTSFFGPITDYANHLDDLLNPKLLGVIPLGEVIAPLRDLRAEIQKVPKLILEQLHDVTEWLKSLTQNPLIVNLKKKLQNIDSKLGSFVDAVSNQLNTELQGANTTLAAIKQQIDKTAADAVNDILSALFLPDPSSRSGRALTPNVTQTLVDLKAKLVDDLTLLQKQSSQIAQKDIDDVKHTCTVFIRQHVQVFQAKIDAMTNQVVSLGRKALATGELEQALHTLEQDLSDASNPINWPVLVQSVPRDLSQMVSAISRFIGSLQRLAKSTADTFAPDTFKKLMLQTVLDLRTNLAAETDELKKSLWGVVDDLDAKLKHYEDPATYPQFQQAKNKFEDARNRLQTIRKELTQNIQKVEDEIKNDVEATLTKVFQAALDKAIASLPTDIGNVMNFAAEMDAVLEELARPLEIKVDYSFAPDIKDAPESAPIFLARRDREGADIPAAFICSFTLRKRLDPLNPNLNNPLPEFRLQATLSDFSIQLLPSAPFFTLQFLKADVMVNRSDHPQVTVQLDPDNPIRFSGALSFVDGFMQAVRNFGAGDEKNGPFIRINPWGVLAGYSFTAPTLTAGGFNIYGLALGATVELSFENKPFRTRFHFAERAHPFVISAGIYGGGGYFLIALGADGVEQLEVSLEFGAYAQINVALATGEAHIFGGIYYRSDRHSCLLTGFVDAGGCITVIGLITCNLDFFLGLSYTSDGTVEGECTVSVDISFGLFSITVHLTAHRTLHKGSNAMLLGQRPNGGPLEQVSVTLPTSKSKPECNPLKALMSEKHWKECYRNRFAEVLN